MNKNAEYTCRHDSPYWYFAFAKSLMGNMVFGSPLLFGTRYVIMLAFTVCSSLIYGGPVSPVVAERVAINGYSHIFAVKPGEIKLTYTEYSDRGAAEYYVFNIAEHNSIQNDKRYGFIIISAEDAVEPIIGYSDEGRFILPIHSPEFAYWMLRYKRQIDFFRKYKISASPEISEEWSEYKNNVLNFRYIHRATGNLNPLVKTVWSQSPTPFNSFCPGGCPAGCVATAMAQIMKYWQYPPHGIDSNSYSWSPYGKLNAYFDTTRYDWSAMPLWVNNKNNSIATLLYQCGVSVDMQYTQSSSGSYMINADNPISAQSAFVKYFGYNGSAIQGLYRSNYSTSEWINLLKTELNAGRPVEYAGAGKDGGHSWVCDGYDSIDYFHMNWGWGGSYDGYYNLNNLTPDGIPLDSNEELLIGIEPAPAEACFTGAPLIIRAGDTVKFTDNSFGPPASPVNSWQWSCPGAQTDYSTLQNPAIIYNTPGTFNVSETVATVEGSNTLTLYNYITVLANNTVNVYPSLNNGSFTIQLANGSLVSSNLNFSLYNLLGQKIFTTILVQYRTFVTLNLEHGMYIFRAYDSSGKAGSTGKLMIGDTQ